MSVLELPKSSKAAILVAILVLAAAIYRVSLHDGANIWLAVAAFFLSGFLGDLFTGFAHFGFDYVFPDKMPILGPVAKEFRQHHDRPTLDPTVTVRLPSAWWSLSVSVATPLSTADTN